MPPRKKTAIQRALNNGKKKVAKKKRLVAKSVKKTKKKVARKVKKTRKALTKRAKKAKKKLVRTRKRTVKNARKRVKKIKRARAKAVRQSYRRRNLTQEAELEFTGDKAQSGSDVAFVREFENDSFGSSKPGEPPKLRSGRGRDAIKAQLITSKKKQHDVAARVYVDKRKAAYMAMWEYRKDGQERPFLKPSLEDNRAMLGNAIGKGLKKRMMMKRNRK